jgi:tetratricopeptide (TPR) repeat protein
MATMWLWLASSAHAEGFSESWYVLRGRANMQIANHKAAAEAFEKAVELNPDNREAQRSLGIAYELSGLTDRAIAQFDKYLARFPDDAEIAYKQAEFLSWSRYDYRRKDAINYLEMGLKVKDDPVQRHKLARLLGRDKATLEDALAQYRLLLEQTPNDEPLRAEYRKLLGWDKSNLNDAIAEYEPFVKSHPDDFDSSYEYARLLAQDKARLPEAAAIYATLTAKRPQDAKLRLEEARLLAQIKGR